MQKMKPNIWQIREKQTQKSIYSKAVVSKLCHCGSLKNIETWRLPTRDANSDDLFERGLYTVKPHLYRTHLYDVQLCKAFDYTKEAAVP